MASAAPPPAGFTVAILGFSPFERSALTASFRLGGGEHPRFRLVDAAARADYVVADADMPAALAAVVAQGKVSDTVFVGDRPPPAAQACLPRPVDPRQIERALDALVRTRPGTVAAPVLPPPTPTATAAASTDVDLLLFDLDVTAAHPLAGRTGGGGGRPVLVVDDSRIARKFLAQRLARLGYRVEVAASAEEALNKLADQAFAIVFADIVLGEDSSADGLALCRQIKESAGADAPRVVLVSGHAASNDRVRSSLAGCDAFIAKPIAEQELLRALRAADAVFAQA